MDLGFKGKVAMVTGTGSQIGIGKAIALTLAKEGCEIISCDIDYKGAQMTANGVNDLKCKSAAFKVDVSNRAEVDEAVKTALNEFGKIDILINTAGLTTGRGGSFLNSKPDEWQQDIAVNLYGTVNCCQAVVPGMVEHKYGKIVNFSSIVVRLPLGSSYTAAKAGVVSVTRWMAAEFGPSGINVNSIAPGMVLSNFGVVKPDANFQKGYIMSAPMRRVVSAEDVANTVAFLSSDISSGITGQLIAVDCGRTMT